VAIIPADSLETLQKEETMKRLLLTLFICLFASTAWANTYDYPFVDAYEATVLGTPDLYAAPLPKKVRSKMLELTVFEDRDIPAAFWYQNKLRYSLVYQNKKAPLIFVIAGTGASFYSSKMLMLQEAFYKAGFHVISLSSPTHPNFIVTASTSSVPGVSRDDSRDLYRVMELAWQQVKKRIEVSEFYLTGYSLGATESAFVSKLDEDKRTFNFKKVLMINPAVNLLNSVKILDQLLVENIPGGVNNFDAFYKKLMHKFAEIYRTFGHIDFSDEFLYEVSKRFPPKDYTLEALIGISFRISSSNLVFTSDVMTQAGFIVPKSEILTTPTSLTDYAKVTLRISFVDYFNGLFYPHFAAKNPGLTKEALVESISLKSIEGYLRGAEKIGLVTNEDDIILAEGELDYLRQVFGSRAKIYVKGGHCGNMAYKDNIAHMINFFKDEGVVK
jgi:hypothetical protein